jgi:hypothetical protein
MKGFSATGPLTGDCYEKISNYRSVCAYLHRLLPSQRARRVSAGWLPASSRHRRKLHPDLLLKSDR